MTSSADIRAKDRETYWQSIYATKGMPGAVQVYDEVRSSIQLQPRTRVRA
jgi:hypothetical protein